MRKILTSSFAGERPTTQRRISQILVLNQYLRFGDMPEYLTAPKIIKLIRVQIRSNHSYLETESILSDLLDKIRLKNIKLSELWRSSGYNYSKMIKGLL